MQETIIEPDKRFVTIKKYCELSGLSYSTINHMCNTGQLNYITTEGGLRRIDTKSGNSDMQPLLERLDKQEKLLQALCRQFRTEV